MISIGATGTQVASIGTEHVLASITNLGTYVLITDLSMLADGDTVELRLYIKTLSGSVFGLAYIATFSNQQIDPVALSIPVPATHAIKATLKQTTGSSRNFDWELVTL